MIQTSDMSSLSLLRGADAAILGSRGSAGAIVITLKDGKDIPARPAQGIITCTPLGYSDSVEFYHPTYDTPEKKNDQRSDLRSIGILAFNWMLMEKQSSNTILRTALHRKI